MTEQATGGDSPGEAQPDGRTIAEWTTLGISLAILALVFGSITWLSLKGDSEPTRVQVTPLLDAVQHEGGVWYLPVEVTNRGDRTAEAVTVEATLDTGEKEPEGAEITFGFLASRETVRGTFVFTSDPASGELTVRPASFKEP